ncbi:leucyl aminopeptidase [Sediminihaliea albiluteola]
MTFTARQSVDPSKTKTQCAVVPVFGKSLSAAAQAYDELSAGAISATMALGDFSGKSRQSCMLPGAGGAKRILLLGCGEQKKFDLAAARKLTETLYNSLNKSSAKDALIYTAELKPQDGELATVLESMARNLTALAYRYTETVAKPKKALALSKLLVSSDKEQLSTKEAQAALDSGAKTGQGINTARNLANLPGNICTPSYLAKQARELARGNKKLSATILDEKKMAELGMGSLLSVSAGSDEPAKLIVLEYKGGKASQQPYVLVGKGITFDTGGISLKPGAKMDEMKFDMGGAASVLGTMQALRDLELPLNVVAIIAAAENMPSGRATKPGDVVTSMSGKTIEILNTDAEGRLVLCDALTYAERYKPSAVVDIATLTGACVVALGSHASGLYANKDELAEQLLAAGQYTHDRAWRMPLWDDYQKQLSSNFADIANIGGPGGGSITAACFLARFTEKYDWAHLDIAGSAWDSSPKGATGRPVALLTRYLQERAEQQ